MFSISFQLKHKSLKKMRGYPLFSFWISIARVKTFPANIDANRAKITFGLVARDAVGMNVV